MANKRLVVANWKMNPLTATDAKKIFTSVKRHTRKFRKVDVVVCPPFLYIANLLSSKRGGVYIGAQDVFWETEGSFTGEISPVQLGKERIDYCIVGHSERRALGETDEEVNKKVKALLKVGLIPIVCIGESERDADGKYLSFIKEQIKKALKDVKQKDLQNIVIAYEPIWAIGKEAKDVIDGESLHEMSIFIRKVISDLYTYRTAFKSPVLYGGSVDEYNANDLIVKGNVQGFLVGRASLEPKGFLNIIDAVNKS